jgi:NAD(P)-dependent dehydrogenase (short-subunit alcohol dehydrogenase family)
LLHQSETGAIPAIANVARSETQAPALKVAKGAVVLMSGNSALFPKAPYAAVGTINAAIVALAKAFSDRGITDGIQVNTT